MRHSLPPSHPHLSEKTHDLKEKKRQHVPWVCVCVAVAKKPSAITIWKISSYLITMNNNNIPPFGSTTGSVWTVAIQLTQQRDERGRDTTVLLIRYQNNSYVKQKRKIAGKDVKRRTEQYLFTQERAQAKIKNMKKSSLKDATKHNTHVSGHCRRKASGATKKIKKKELWKHTLTLLHTRRHTPGSFRFFLLLAIPLVLNFSRNWY